MTSVAPSILLLPKQHCILLEIAPLFNQSGLNSLPIPLATFFSSTSPLAWIKSISATPSSTSLFPNIPWHLIFPISAWAIWSTRNKLVVENTPFSLDGILKRIQSLSLELFSSLPHKSLKPNWKSLFISWKPPPLGFFKLNTDGSTKGNLGMVGASGLIRDHKGNWISGFSRNIAFTHSLAAELWAL